MTKNDELAQSLEDLRAEVRELREMVNMLVDIIVNMENDDQGDIENEYFDMNRFDKDPRFSM